MDWEDFATLVTTILIGLYVIGGTASILVSEFILAD